MSGKLEDTFIAKRASKSGDFVEFVPLMTISPYKPLWVGFQEATELLGHITFGSKGTRMKLSAMAEGGKK
tara:strand:+ start:5136 stop:5345 length:210 start_codon:yes stop_codon:yes gene_type:complete